MSRSVHPRRIFIDTSAYFALVNPNDAQHADAAAIVRRLAVERRQAFTSNFILAETHALVLGRLGQSVALHVLRDLDRSATVVVRVSLADERRAREILAQYHGKDFSLTDATSFAIMERLRIDQSLTLYDHFAQFGFLVPGTEWSIQLENDQFAVPLFSLSRLASPMRSSYAVSA